MKKEVMLLAWQFIKKLGMNLSSALKQAWKNIKLKYKLIQGIVTFRFRKLDGSIRLATGTLKQELIPEVTESRIKPDIQTYFDMEKKAWRCFRKDLLLTS